MVAALAPRKRRPRTVQGSTSGSRLCVLGLDCRNNVDCSGTLKSVAIKKPPNLSPDQVVHLQDALLANADKLLTAALTVLDQGSVGLARSLAILGLKESGKAIAVHERRVQMPRMDEGTTFRCDALDELWASHEKKLQAVHQFLVNEEYWFDVEPLDPDVNQAILGTITAWSRRNTRAKERGLYVELNSLGDPLSPLDLADAEAVRDVSDPRCRRWPVIFFFAASVARVHGCEPRPSFTRSVSCAHPLHRRLVVLVGLP